MKTFLSMNNKHSLIPSSGITPDNIAFYQAQGYLIAPGLLSFRETQDLKKETAAIFKGQRGEIEGLLPVDLNEADQDVLKKYVAIHFPHKISPLIHNSLFNLNIVAILKCIVGPNLKCMQSMLFVKAPGKKGQSWHQDEFYIPTRDKSLVGAWIAIDDATVDNGCLWIIPGRPGFMMKRVENKCENSFHSIMNVKTSDTEMRARQAYKIFEQENSV